MKTWNDLIAGFSAAHILQTTEWGSIKANYGWQPYYLHWRSPSQSGLFPFSYSTPSGTGSTENIQVPSETTAAALCLIRRVRYQGITLPISIAYCPKGPLLAWDNRALHQQVFSDISRFAKGQGALVIKIDPDVRLGTGSPDDHEAEPNPVGLAVQEDLQMSGWRLSKEQVQFRNTVLIDLSPDEEALLAKMKQKTRYNIRLANRRGVTVRVGGQNDLDILYDLYARTALRDGFVIRDKGYYQSIWQTFMGTAQIEDPNRPSAKPLIAEVDGVPVAAVVIFRFGRSAWFLYGMSSDLHREKMPNYLLQWEAIKLAKTAGCRVYDMWGAPDTFGREDPLWGVYRFKDGFQGTFVRGLGAWDLPLQPALYKLYSKSLPRLLAMMRHRGKAQTRQDLEPL